jgi:hypothetical protein
MSTKQLDGIIGNLSGEDDSQNASGDSAVGRLPRALHNITSELSTSGGEPTSGVVDSATSEYEAVSGGWKDSVALLLSALAIFAVAGGLGFGAYKIFDRNPNAGGVVQAHAVARQVEQLAKGQSALPSAFTVADVVANINAGGTLSGDELVVTPVGNPTATNESFTVDRQSFSRYGTSDSEACLTFELNGRFFTDVGAC